MAKQAAGVTVTNMGGWQSPHHLLEQDEASLKGVTSARVHIYAAIEAYLEKTGSLHTLNKQPYLQVGFEPQLSEYHFVKVVY